MFEWGRFLLLVGAGAVIFGAVLILASRVAKQGLSPDDEKYWLVLVAWITLWAGLLAVVFGVVISIL